MKKIISILLLLNAFSIFTIELEDLESYIGQYNICDSEFYQIRRYKNYIELSDEEVLKKMKAGEVVFYKMDYYSFPEDNLNISMNKNGRYGLEFLFSIGNYNYMRLSHMNFEFTGNETNKLTLSEYNSTYSIEFISDVVIVITTIRKSEIVPAGISYYKRMVFQRVE